MDATNQAQCPFCDEKIQHDSLNGCSVANDVVELCSLLSKLKSDIDASDTSNSARISQVQIRLHELLGKELETKPDKGLSSNIRQRRNDSTQISPQKDGEFSKTRAIKDTSAPGSVPSVHIILLVVAGGILFVYAKAGSEAAITATMWTTVLLVVFYCNWLASNARDNTLGKSSGLIDGLPKLD